MTRFLLDTNVYIRAWRSSEAAEQLDRFSRRYVAATHLSSVVFHELLLGANNPAMARDLVSRLAGPFTRTKRLVVPSHGAWRRAAEIVAQMAWDDGLNRSTLPRGFVNDVLIAASCRENGLTLITENMRDFQRIRQRMPFEYVTSWPQA